MQFAGADVPARRATATTSRSADVNRDGKLDIIVATSNGGDGDLLEFTAGHAEVLLGSGDGTFTAGPGYEVPRGAWQVVVGDFTRDGIIDIATANRSSITRDDAVRDVLEDVGQRLDPPRAGRRHLRRPLVVLARQPERPRGRHVQESGARR